MKLPRAADTSLIDYTGLGIDVVFPDRIDTSVITIKRDLIDLSELEIRLLKSVDERSLTTENTSNKIKLLDKFLPDNDIMETSNEKLGN